MLGGLFHILLATFMEWKSNASMHRVSNDEGVEVGIGSKAAEFATAVCKAAMVEAVDVAAAVLTISVNGSSNDGLSSWTVSIVIGIVSGMVGVE